MNISTLIYPVCGNHTIFTTYEDLPYDTVYLSCCEKCNFTAKFIVSDTQNLSS
jgi:hypothetical protein